MKQQQLAALPTQKLSPVYTPNTRPTLQWNGLPEKYKFDPFVDSEHTDDYYTKDNKDAWGPKVRASPREPAARRARRRAGDGACRGASCCGSSRDLPARRAISERAGAAARACAPRTQDAWHAFPARTRPLFCLECRLARWRLRAPQGCVGNAY